MRGILLSAVLLGCVLPQVVSAQSDAPVPIVRQRPAARNSAARVDTIRTETLVPLDAHERALQILDRFTFGLRPGDVDHVMVIGVDKWFEQQLHPESIKDAALDRRLLDFPTLNMTPAQALMVFPDRGTIQRVADGKQPMPADPQLAAMYEVQIAKLRKEVEARKVDANGNPLNEPSDAERAADKQEGQITAERVAGELFAITKNQRMSALIAMPVEDRIEFASNVNGDQKNLLLADFTPREREIFLGMAAGVGAQYQIGQELSQAKMVRAIGTERQLQEVMTDFWFNHFNIYIGKDSDQWYTTSYERDAIRKNALGKFGDLLLATAESPAMLVYLDNWLSIGPNSQANGVNPSNPRSKRGNKGLNENYGREIMELQTVGVNGGYTQSDVTNLSAILTGWTVNQPYLAGGFQFDARRHEPGMKAWFGHRIGDGLAFVPQGGSAVAAEKAALSVPAMDDTNDEMMMGGGAAQKAETTPGNSGMKEGLEALNVLAHSPQTAHFICWEIAQRFVADDPPAALVDRMAKMFLSSDGDIKAVLRTLVASPEFNSKKYFRNKVKTPMEFLTSAYRTTMTEPSNPGALVNTIRNMGMPLYYALPPTGYYITADHWMNTGALVDRLNFAYQLTNGKFANQKFDASKVVALGLMSEQTLPAQDADVAAGPVKYAEATLSQTMPTVTSAAPQGTEIALKVLESTMIGGEVSAHTNELIHKQITQANGQRTSPADMLNLLTALVMGSPEFQVR
jgi:uncharacterized protein (DUF1800 family)